jgi:hypothetical protein
LLTARRGGRRLVGPEIDAGVRSITKKCASRPAYCCANVLVLIYLTAKSLILPSAPLRSTSGSSAVVSLQCSRLYRCFLCAPETVRASRAKGSRRRRPCWLLVPSGRKTLPSLRAFEIQGNGYHRPIAESCFAPAKRNMAVAKPEWLEGTGIVH